MGNSPPPFERLVGSTATTQKPRTRLELLPLEDRVTPTPVVTIEKISDAVEGGADGVVRLTRTGSTSGGLNVIIGVSGTATDPDDFLRPETPISFGTGKSSVDVPIEAYTDDFYDPDETVVVSIGTSSEEDYEVGTEDTATVTIIDAVPLVAVTATDTFEGAATGGFTFTRSGNLSGSLAVSYTVSGTATSKTDYDELSGSVTFAAGEDRVEVPVEAFGDNLADDGETVIATIDEDEDYEIDGVNYEGTVTIADQPLTVSVMRLNDGTEGGTNAKFRFTRSGDISGELEVTYTVGGTATSGTDFTAMSGSVTFPEDEDTVDVTVTITDDGTAEQTETVTVTLDESEDYLLGIASDSVLIRDNDTPRITWTGADVGNPYDWNDSDNWSTFAVPTSGDDVYFDGNTSNVSCANAGYGLSTLYGLHIIGAYSGTVTLANALSVGTYEQTAGTLNQPSTGRNLTITAAMLWTGGTLNGDTESMADVSLTGSTAVGFLGPPNSGSMGTSSTLKILSGAVATFLPGTLEFMAGSGMYIDGEMVLYTEKNAPVVIDSGAKSDVQVFITSDGRMTVDHPDRDAPGLCTFHIPIQNEGKIFINVDIKLEVNGVVSLLKPFSIVQTSGKAEIGSGSLIIPQFGMAITGGDLLLRTIVENQVTQIDGNLVFAGNLLSSESKWLIPIQITHGRLLVNGNVTWSSGTFATHMSFDGVVACDEWTARGEFTIGAGAQLEPIIDYPGEVANPLTMIRGRAVYGDLPPIPAELQNGWRVGKTVDKGIREEVYLIKR